MPTGKRSLRRDARSDGPLLPRVRERHDARGHLRPRLAALSEQARTLEGRDSELATLAEDTEQPERITRADLDALRRELRAALEHSTPTRAKTVLQAMIDTIRVDARDRIEPTFRVPAVREPCGSMEGSE